MLSTSSIFICAALIAKKKKSIIITLLIDMQDQSDKMINILIDHHNLSLTF